jgi:hypothetical protein
LFSTTRSVGKGALYRRSYVQAARGCACAGGWSVPAASPSAGARIDVLSQLHRAGARMRAIATTRTSRKGGFSFKAPPGDRGTLRFGYRSHLNDTAFTATLDVLQRVKASATLRASRRFVPRGGA